jgi:autotransporter-associated beta strand protein
LDDSTLGNNFSSRRLGTQPISLQGGDLGVNLGNVSGGTETIGSVTAGMGENTLALSVGSGSSFLSGGTLARASGATLNFTGPLSSSDRMVFSGMSSGSNFIDAGTFVNGADYAVYDAGGYVRAMAVGSNACDYALNSVTPFRHVLLTTAVPLQTSSLTVSTLSFSGGGTGFALTSAATLTLSAGGILKTGGGAATIIGGADINTAGEYVLRTDTASDQLIITMALTGGTGLTKSGLGTLMLVTAGDSYRGQTTIDAGTLKAMVTGAIPATSPLVIANAASLDLSGQAQTVAGITLYDGSVENSGAVTALTLGGNAAGVTYAGVGSGSSISSGTLNLADIGSLSASHTFSVARGQGSADLDIRANIANGSANSQALVKTGSGILLLSGTNTYSGGTQIQAGTLSLASNNAIPAASILTLSAGTLNLGGCANTAASLVIQSGLITGNGSFTAASSDLQSGTLSGSLIGSGSLSKTTSGVVTITSSNSYSGGTTLSGGTLAVSADNNLGSTAGALTLDGGTLQVLGTSFTSTIRPVTTSSNGGGISVTDPNNILTLATQNLAGTGPLTKAGQGTLRLGGSVGSAAITVQDGSLQLTAGSSQLTGNPALSLWNVATFSFSDHNESVSTINLTGGTINTGTGTLNLAGSLNYARSIWPATIQGNLSLGASAATFSVDQGSSANLTITANISGSPTAGLVKTGNGLLTLLGTNSYSGGTTINAGNVVFSSTNSIPGSGKILLNESGTLIVTGAYPTVMGWLNSGDISVNSSGVLALSGMSSESINMAPYGSLALGAVAAGATYSGVLTPSGSTYRLGGGGGTLSVTSNLIDQNLIPRSLVVGSGGTGTVVLSGSNTYSGGTTITAGTLQVGNGGCDATLGSGPIFVSSDSLLNFDLGNTLAVSNAITSGGEVAVVGPGTVVFTGSNTYSGGTAISAGTLQIGNGGASGSLGPNAVIDDGTIDFSRSNVYIVRVAINGSGDLVQHGPGTLVLNASNDYTGTTTISGGTLQVGNGGTLGVGPVVDNSVLLLSRSDTITLANTISGSGSVSQSGSGKVILTASNSYTGGTTVSSGTLEVLATGALPYGTLAIDNGGVFLFDPEVLLSAPLVAGSLDIPVSSLNGVASAIPPSLAVDPPASSQPAANPVPEPNSLLLLLAGGGGGLSWHVRRPRRISGAKKPILDRVS